jgi:hypothetical protein
VTILRVLVTAFVSGCILASCGRPVTAAPCLRTRTVDTLWLFNSARTDSVPAIVNTERCE